MALTAAWTSACDMLGVKTQTLGPNDAVTASGQRLADGEGSALIPWAVAVIPTAARTPTLTRRRTIRCMKTPHCEGVRKGATYDKEPRSRRVHQRSQRRRHDRCVRCAGRIH